MTSVYASEGENPWLTEKNCRKASVVRAWTAE